MEPLHSSQLGLPTKELNLVHAPSCLQMSVGSKNLGYMAAAITITSYACIAEDFETVNKFSSQFYFIEANQDFLGYFFARAKQVQKNIPKKSRFVKIK